MSNTTRDIAPAPDFSLISTWSNTDYDMLTIDLVNQMTNSQIQQMQHPELIPTSAISGFTEEQIPALVNNISLFTSDWLNSLSISAIQALSTTQLNQINPTTLSALDTSHLSALTASQVGAMNNLTALSSAQFGALNISGMSTSTVKKWTATQYAGLTAQQMSSLNNSQMYATAHPNWVPESAVSGILPSQIASFSSHFYIFTASWLNHLTLDTWQALNASRLNQITAATLSQLDDIHLSALTADQVSTMNNLGNLSSSQQGLINISKQSVATISSWTQAQYATLSAQQIASLSTEQTQALQHPEWIPTAVADGLTTDQTTSLGNEPVQSQQQQTLLPTVVADGLTTDQTTSLGNEPVQSQQQQTLLPTAVADGLTTDQTKSLGNEPVQSQQQQTLLPPAVADGLTTDQTKSLGNEPVQSQQQQTLLPPAVADGLTTDQIAGWTKDQYATLSAQQITSFSNAQIQALQHPEWIPATAVAGLTADQVPAINVTGLSATWLNNLSLPALQALSSTQLNQITASTVKALDSAHLSALTASQVSTMNNLTSLSKKQLGLINITGQSTSQIAGWTPEQYATLSAQQITSLSTEQIQAIQHPELIPTAAVAGLTADQVPDINLSELPAAWLNALSTTALPALSDAQLGQLTVTQVAGMTHLSSLTSAQFGLLDISGLTNSAIGKLSQTLYQGITAQQISSLSVTQINAMAHANYMSDTAAAGFTAEQIAGCTFNFYWFSAGWLNNLSTAAFQAISCDHLNEISSAKLGALDNTHMAALTADQLAGITTSFSCFSASSLNSITTTAFQSITSAQLNKISTANLAALDNSHLSALTTTQVNAMTHLSALSSDQFGLLDISALPTTAIAAWKQAQYSGLTAQQMSTLSPEQIQSMKHPEWLPVSVAGGMKPEQVASLGTQLSLLPVGFVNSLSVPAFQALTSSQLANLTPAIIASLDVSHIQTLGRDVLQSLNNDELLGISTSLSAQQRGTLTQSQLALLSTSASTGSALINGLSDTTLKSIMTTTAADNTSLFNFETIEKVLKSFASSLTDPLTATQYGDLTSYVQNIGSVCGTDSSLYSIVNGMVTGAGGASVQWTSQEDGTFTRIGCLGVGSSATQFSQLITNWMDGTNAPASSSTEDTVGRPLFADGGPTINDIHQGQDGDCSFLSALQGVVHTNPDFIKSMFVQNPNNTYSVRFFNKGVPTWVTVDNDVFVNGNSVASSSWVAIAERANVAYEATYLNDDNSYSSLPGGFSKLDAITGDTNKTFWAKNTTEDKWNTTDFELLKTAVLNGAPAQLSSWESTKDAVTGQTNFVHAHAFAIIGFDTTTSDFILTNPWGADRNDSSVAGTFEASMDEMWQHGNYNTGIAFVNSSGASGAAGQLVTAMATMAATPGASSDVTTALPAIANTSLLAKPLV